MLDPIWTTATITGLHGAYVFDTLYAVDDKLKPQPQMAEGLPLLDVIGKADTSLAYIMPERLALTDLAKQVTHEAAERRRADRGRARMSDHEADRYQ